MGLRTCLESGRSFVMHSIQLQIFPVNMQYTDCNKKDTATKLLHFAYTKDLKRPGQITLVI